MALMSEPKILQAGDTLRWTVRLPEHPANEGWTLSYRLINAGSTIDLVAGPDPQQPELHLVSVAAATSAEYLPGTYTVTKFVSRGLDRYTLAQGEIRVLPDLAASATPMDARSEARRALDDLRAALRRWLSTQGAVSEYEIAGRRMRFASMEDIQKRIQLAESEVAREVEAERLAAGLGRRRRVLVRF